MGLLAGLTGNAGMWDNREAFEAYGPLLTAGEQIELAYKLVRDAVLFTNRRIIVVNKQGMTGKKISYTSIPWRSVHRFAVETAGHFDLDGELKIWVSGDPAPALHQEFNRDVDIYQVQAHVAAHVG